MRSTVHAYLPTYIPASSVTAVTRECNGAERTVLRSGSDRCQSSRQGGDEEWMCRGMVRGMWDVCVSGVEMDSENR